jgi:aspartyl-tRNA(Asn)/glutamyl-tRNA(Gln) amidotransferase subunit A
MKTASSRHRLEQALARIADPSGEGARACLTATMIPTTPVAASPDVNPNRHKILTQ